MKHAQSSLRRVTLAGAMGMALWGAWSPCSFAADSRQGAAPKLRIDGVSIVDPRDGSVQPNMSLTVSGGKIASITSIGPATSDPDTQIVDAQGKFVIPGLNDMHAHILGESDDVSASLSLLLANGITGFRQMAASQDLLRARQQGKLPIKATDPELLAMPGAILTPLNAGSPAAAIKTINQQKAAGADFIKLILLSAPTFFAAVEESKRLGLPTTGHVPDWVDLRGASKAGMTGMEHFGAGSALSISCSTDEAAMRAELEKSHSLEGFPANALFLIPFKDELMKWLAPKIVTNITLLFNEKGVESLKHGTETFSEEKCRALGEVYVANGTWQTPTLIRLKTSPFGDAPEFMNDPNLRYVSSGQRALWQETEQKFEKKWTPAQREVFRNSYLQLAPMVKLFDSIGVKMMTGADTGGSTWIVPGFGLHAEFDEWDKVGVPPLHVLQAATINPAIFLGRTATMGTVEPGKNADLVLLDANPVESVQALHGISAVVRAGRYWSREDLDALKNEVATRATGSAGK